MYIHFTCSPSVTHRTVSCEKEQGRSRARLLDPANLVDLLLYFQALEVVKLRLVALEGAEHVVVAPEDRWMSHDTGLACTLEREVCKGETEHEERVWKKGKKR